MLERLCDVLADTSTGFTGSEIGKFLKRLSIADPLPDMTKRHRLYGRSFEHKSASLLKRASAVFLGGA